MNMFRELRADEIDCRISHVKKDGSGLSLMLYNDARCDQNILDETVGPMNWKREHTLDNRNCIVSIWDAEKAQWIGKEDTGTESNTEREKGLASDSFKRACFNWGIGRELYTAPFIWITPGNYNVAKDGKVYDRFTVHGIGYTNGVITGLEIKNQKLGRVVFKYGKITQEAPEKPEKPDDEPEAPAGQAEPLKPFTPPANTGNGGAVVTTSATVPPVPEEKPKEPSDTQKYLLKAVTELRKARNITTSKHNKLFAEQREYLISEGYCPDKKLEEYTMAEAENLIKMVYEKFPVEVAK